MERAVRIDEPGVYRPAPPAPQARLAWPASFGLRFALFVDTEEEFDWSRPFDRANRSTSAIAALPQAHRMFADAGVKPVYLVDHPVASDPRAAGIVADLIAAGTADVGTHLHPWVNPPFEEPLTNANSFAGNLPPALEAAKLDALHETITAAFGRAPRVFRAGRYGLGPSSLALLESRGYRMDSSMRSLFDYSAQGGPDYSATGVTPFWCGPQGTLLELPLSAAYIGPMRRLGPAMRGLPGKGALSRARLCSRVALTPEGMPVGEALSAIRTLVNDGVRLLTFSYHSPSLVPGHTPYVRDAGDLAGFYRWWGAMFDLLAKLGAMPVSLDEIIDTAWSTRTG